MELDFDKVRAEAMYKLAGSLLGEDTMKQYELSTKIDSDNRDGVVCTSNGIEVFRVFRSSENPDMISFTTKFQNNYNVRLDLTDNTEATSLSELTISYIDERGNQIEGGIKCIQTGGFLALRNHISHNLPPGLDNKYVYSPQKIFLSRVKEVVKADLGND